MKALIILVVLGIILLYGEFIKNKRILIPVAIIGLIAAFCVNIMDWNTQRTYYKMAVFDNYAIAFIGLILFIAILIFLLTGNYYKGVTKHVAEIYALVIFCLAGTLLMCSFTNLSLLFIGIETMSIPLYLLAGSKKFSIRSNEASFKYFLMSSIATAIFLFGVVLIYGATVSFDIIGISEYIKLNHGNFPPIFKLGLVFITIGFTFKVAAVPFHFWAPDVYEGSPTLFTAFMATIIKVSSFAAFYRLYEGFFIELTAYWKVILMIITALTLIVGNLAAVQQTNVKRLLAYSSISHTGFMLMGLLSFTIFSANALFYYAVAYSVANIPAFGILILVKNYKGANSTIDAFNGLGKRNPIFGLMMTISLLSLAGIPLTGGFFAKYYIFVNALQSNYIWIVIIAIIATLIGVYYYFKLIVAIYFKKGETEMITCDVAYLVSLSLATLLTLILGFFPSLVLNLNI